MAKMIKRIRLADLAPTGSTRLNCACSDNPYGGYRLGTIANIIGQYSAGKTVLALTCLAACAQLPRFKDYNLVFDLAEQAEQTQSFDLEQLFGSKLSNRIELGIQSDTVQDFYGNILDVIADGRPWIYVLDSYDSLRDAADEAKAKLLRKKKDDDEKKKKVKGSYHAGVAKTFKRVLGHIKTDLKGNLLIIISQVIQNMDRQNKFQPKFTKTGGEALKHYSFHEVWLSYGDIVKHPSTKLQIGRWANAKVSKNKLTGKKREVSWIVYDQLGMDDITSCIDYLVKTNWWPRVSNQTINAKDFELKATKNKLIKYVENEKDAYKQLKKAVGDAWKQQEADTILDRKPRFA